MREGVPPISHDMAHSHANDEILELLGQLEGDNFSKGTKLLKSKVRRASDGSRHRTKAQYTDGKESVYPNLMIQSEHSRTLHAIGLTAMNRELFDVIWDMGYALRPQEVSIGVRKVDDYLLYSGTVAHGMRMSSHLYIDGDSYCLEQGIRSMASLPENMRDREAMLSYECEMNMVDREDVAMVRQAVAWLLRG